MMFNLETSPLFTADVELGQVEIKDSDSTAQANIKAANTARTTGTVVVATQPIDAAGNVLGRTAANTARATSTLVDPVQVVDAAGNVLSVSAANTARSTATTVMPVQQVSAAGAVDTLTTVTTVGTVTTLTGGGVAANAADSGNPIKVGGKYVAAGVTLDDGDRGDLSLDSKGNLNVNLNTKISGEDQTNDVMKTEQQFSLSYQASAADNKVIKASAGFLHSVILGTWVDNGVIEISDHASDGDGNIVIKLTTNATDDTNFPCVIPVNAKFTTGICADVAALTDVTFVYR